MLLSRCRKIENSYNFSDFRRYVVLTSRFDSVTAGSLGLRSPSPIAVRIGRSGLDKETKTVPRPGRLNGACGTHSLHQGLSSTSYVTSKVSDQRWAPAANSLTTCGRTPPVRNWIRRRWQQLSLSPLPCSCPRVLHG